MTELRTSQTKSSFEAGTQTAAKAMGAKLKPVAGYGEAAGHFRSWFCSAPREPVAASCSFNDACESASCQSFTTCPAIPLVVAAYYCK